MKIVNGKQVREALSKQIRVYLCGNLSAPEDFEFARTDGLEIGISHYDKYTAEKHHLHEWNHEYNIIKSGAVNSQTINQLARICYKDEQNSLSKLYISIREMDYRKWNMTLSQLGDYVRQCVRYYKV